MARCQRRQMLAVLRLAAPLARPNQAPTRSLELLLAVQKQVFGHMQPPHQVLRVL